MSRRHPNKNASLFADFQANREAQESWIKYFMRLCEIAISVFKWENLPDGIDPRFIELILFYEGHIVFFRDEELEQYLCLKAALGGKWNLYDIPTERHIYANNGYTNDVTDENSVIIYNNLMRIPSSFTIREFSERLAELDSIIDVNTGAQADPMIVRSGQKNRLTMQNMIKKVRQGNRVIFVDENLDMNDITALDLGAPFTADKLYNLKNQYWNEALTFLGIPNVSIEKRERLVSDEVTRGQGGTIACRYSRLEARRQAAEQINKMFGLNVSVDYREEYKIDKNERGPEASGAIEPEGSV